MADINIIKQELKDYVSTLQETSFDSKNEESLCASQMQVYNFDKYKQHIDKNKKSFDALYLHNNAIYCIEFRNQKYSEIKSQEIKGKYQDGLDMLKSLFYHLNIQIVNNQFYFFVVFKNPSSEMKYHERGKAKEVLFGLESLKNILANKPNPNPIHRLVRIETRPTNDFIRQYKEILQC